jgi:hypothetical protein
MKCAVISSKQLRETGRWDAAYNIAYREYWEELPRLLAKGKESLITAAKSLPFDHSSAGVRRGNFREGHFERWTPEELALYLLQIRDKGMLGEVAESVRVEMQARLDAIAAASVMLERPEEPSCGGFS